MTLTITCPVCGEVMFDAPSDAKGVGFPCASCGAALFLPEHDRLLTASSAQAGESNEELSRKVATIWDQSDTDFEINIGGATADPPSDHEILVSLGAGSDSAWLVDLNKKVDDMGKDAVDDAGTAKEASGPNPSSSGTVDGNVKAEAEFGESESSVSDEGTEVLEWGDVTSNPSGSESAGDTFPKIESPTPAGEPVRRGGKQRERELRTVNVYLSATEDLAAERVLAERVLTRMSCKYAEVLDLTPHVFDHGGAATEPNPTFAGPDSADIVFLLAGRVAGSRFPPTCPDDRRGDYRSGTEYELHAAVLDRPAPGRLVFVHHPHSQGSSFDATQSGERLAGHLADLLETWLTGSGAPAADSYFAAEDGVDAVREVERQLSVALDAIVAERGLTPRERGDDAGSHWWSNGSPFRALSPYTRAETAVFEGRTREVLGAISFLRKQAKTGTPWVLLAGHAGCGKTSLARAGIAGLLTQPGVITDVSVWRKCVFRPSDAPESLVESLASALMEFDVLPEMSASGMNPTKLSQIMRKNPRGFARHLTSALETLADGAKGRLHQGEARLLLVVDALEEVFSGESFSPEDRTEFFLNLSSLVASRSVWLVATVRSEFVDLVARQPELASIQPLKARYSVEAPTTAEIERIVGIPAEAAGLWFGKDPASGKWVDRQLVEEAEASPDRLWELSYCLQGLYDRRTPRGKITQTALDELGGVAGAVASIAEAKLATLSPAAAAALPRLAKELVHDHEDSGILLPKSVLARYFSKDQDLAPLVDALLNIGLLSRYKPNGGGTLLRLTSIGVVSSWPRFAEAFEASRHMPGFDPASMGASGDSSCEIDVSGLAASAPAEMPVEDGIVDASSTDFKLPATRPQRSRQLKIAGAVASCLLLAGGWWWGMRPYLFAKPQEARSVASVGDTSGEETTGENKAAPAIAPAPAAEAVPAVPDSNPPAKTDAVAAAAVGDDHASEASGKPEPVPSVAAQPVSMKGEPPPEGVAVVAVVPSSRPGASIPVPSASPPPETSVVDKPGSTSPKTVPPVAPSTPADQATAVAAVSKPPADVSAANANGNQTRLTGAEDQIVNSLKMTLRRIPAGTFEMGSPAGESGRHDNEPRRRITITRTFYMGAHEVTQGQFEELMGRNPSGFKGKGMPVENVSWTDAIEFCRRLSERDAEKGMGVVYRLPTEAEWEYACRAGSAKAFSFGNAAGSRDANFDGTQPYGNGKSGPDLATTIKVGAYSPNAWGLYDMHGNVAEWCGDWFARTVDLASTTDPAGPATGTRRVIRGGSWLSAGVDCRSAWRGSEAPDRFDSILGFRIVADVP